MGMNRRAKSIDELKERISGLVSEEGMAHALDFRPRPSDVIIATYPKAGTTWMQQIVHGLRTEGDMDFDEITAVVPWIETAYDMGLDLEADHKGQPRAFKSHWSGEQVPPGCRYICIIRDPYDTMVSFYNFLNGWFLEPGAVSADEFTEFIIRREDPMRDYWAHLKTWWARRKEPRVLLLAFEDLIEDLSGNVRRVADFIGLGGNEPAIGIAIRQAGYDFMKAHERQFDDHLVTEARNQACGLPRDAGSSKIKSGKVGAHKDVLSDATRTRLDQVWACEIEAVLGLRDYDDLRRALRAGE